MRDFVTGVVDSLLSKPGTAPSPRQQILARLREIVPEVQQSGATSGVDRRVRHAGTYSARSAEEVDTCKQNKETLQSVAASRNLFICVRTCSPHSTTSMRISTARTSIP
ncbi:hypothetical protein B0H21DRAFT_103204 [Amylocystis lapponica]|nr:hypothetical protein B0H21DRAFT_103204 [Amylocystis lapponica]